MNFLERATLYAEMGIPVFPLRPGTKEPPSFMGQWQEHATTDPGQIAAWNAENPNYNCGLVAKPNGVVFLEFDVGEGMKAAAKETGQSMPVTRVHVSGKGFAHWVFLQTDRSRALGNRQARKKEGGEWFSFRQNNRYIVGPGSIHPNGNEYFVNPKRVIQPEPIPDWVCDWVERYTLSEKSGDSDYPDVVDEFDFDDWLEHYGISIKRTVGYWHIADEGCIVAGYFHEHSTLTGIFFDGAKLGWHCFAGGCEGSSMSIGGFIKWLNQRKGQEPYDKPIWPEREEGADADEELDMSQFGNSHLEPEPKIAFTTIFPDAVEISPTAVAPAKEPCQAGEGSRCQCGLEHRYLQSTLRPEIQIAMAECMSPERSDSEEISEARQTTQDEEQEATKLRMPEEAMYGRLGELARMTELPLGLAYPALLGEFSIVPDIDEMLYTRINLYVVLIAPIGGGKNQAIKRGRILLKLKRHDWKPTSPAGDRGLMNVVGDQPGVRGPGQKGRVERVPGPRKMLMLSNEMSETLKKAAMDGSALPATLCDFWDANEKEVPDKTGNQVANCRLSWVGGVPIHPEKPEDFSDLFGSETAKGLLARMLLGYTGEDWRYKNWDPPPEPEEGIPEDGEWSKLTPEWMFVEGVEPEAKALYDSWWVAEEGVDTGRLKQNLMKVALLTASANNEKLITARCMRCALAFIEWQLRLRRIFTSGNALEHSTEAKFAERAMKAFRRRGGEEHAVSWKIIAHDLKWNDIFGPRIVNQGIQNLHKNGQIYPDQIEKGGKVKPSTHLIWVRRFPAASRRV